MNTGVSWGGLWIDLAEYGGPADPDAYLGEEVYAVMTRTGANQITLYANVNGTWLTPVSGNISWTLSADDGFFIGRHYWGPDHMFDGTIDEVAIYARALSEDEVFAHYAAAVPEPGTLALLAVAGLAAVWRRRIRA